MRKTRLNKSFDKQFGRYIKKKRIEKGWSQLELASRVENNFQNISRLERGDITPTLFWCYKLSEAFEMELSKMIEELNFQTKK